MVSHNGDRNHIALHVHRESLPQVVNGGKKKRRKNDQAL
jgi:hypothetical protein